MALTAYMKVEGKSQGEIKGDCQQGGDKKDKILVYAVEHLVEIPKDTHTGLPTGQRIHHPLTITKHLDQASPKLYKACCTGEQCTVTIDHYRIENVVKSAEMGRIVARYDRIADSPAPHIIGQNCRPGTDHLIGDDHTFRPDKSR